MTRVKAYLGIQAALCILLVLLLSVSAVSIYHEGTDRKAEHPLEAVYEPERVAEKFAPIVPLFIVVIGMTAAGLLLGIKDKDAEKPVRDAESERDLAVRRVIQPDEKMFREREYQKRVSVLGLAAFFACMVPAAIYVLNGNHFPAEPEQMIAGLVRVLIPWTAVGIGCLMVRAALLEKSFLRETEAAKSRAAAEKAEKSETGIGLPEPVGDTAGTGKNIQNGNRRAILRTVFIAAAAVLILMGILNGSAGDVLIKAVNICTECVGLG